MTVSGLLFVSGTEGSSRDVVTVGNYLHINAVLQTQNNQNVAIFPETGEEVGTAAISGFSAGHGLRMASWLEEGVVLVREAHD